MIQRTLGSAVLGAVVGLVVACGAPPSTQQCGHLTFACGGTITGAWQLSKDSCLQVETNTPGVSAALDGTLTLHFEPDGGYSAVATGTSYVVTILPSFFQDAGTVTLVDGGSAPQGCDSIPASAKGGSCTGGGTGNCVCTYPVSSLEENGTYSTADGRITLPAGPRATSTADYCVSGGTLVLGRSMGNFFTLGLFTRQ